MRCVYSPKHLLHNPMREVWFGQPRRNYEIPARAESIRTALEKQGGFSFETPRDHGLAPIVAVHDPDMVRFLEGVWSQWRREIGEVEMLPDTVLLPALRHGMAPSREPAYPLARVGYWCFDTMTPIVAGTYEAARAAVDVALTAADVVVSGDLAAYALCRPPGHHAARAAFGGYCFFNNAAVAAQYLVEQTGEPIAVLDLDYHHGNGTQQIFYERRDVFYASLHGDPQTAFPYFTGYRDETGAGAGTGATLNVPLAARCDDEAYLRALEEALDAVTRAATSIVVVSLGFDTYKDDPICDFELTSSAYHEIGRSVAATGRRLVIVQEGGYFLPAIGRNAVQWLLGATGGRYVRQLSG